MKAAAWIVFFFGLLVLTGGIMGHVMVKSSISLIMGGIFGILLLLAAIGMFKDNLFPAYFAIILTLVLDAFFTYRWLLTFKFFPSGIMFLISSTVFIVIAILIRNHLRKERGKKD